MLCYSFLVLLYLSDITPKGLLTKIINSLHLDHEPPPSRSSPETLYIPFSFLYCCWKCLLMSKSLMLKKDNNFHGHMSPSVSQDDLCSQNSKSYFCNSSLQHFTYWTRTRRHYTLHPLYGFLSFAKKKISFLVSISPPLSQHF